MATRLLPGTHRCPAPSCDRIIPDPIYCCVDDWLKLPQRARTWISHTARLSVLHPERRGAIEFASRCWKLGLTSENTKPKPRV